MGLGNDDDLVVGDGDDDGGKSFGSISCSICLEVVADNGDRSWAKLQCGHQFHLDCIGSAFNIKGAMQCPNCRKIQKGQWLYANGSKSLPEYGLDDITHDGDLYDLSYSEMSFGVNWCPFSSLTRLASSFEDGDYPLTAYHDLPGQHAIFGEHTVVPSATHPCPYIAYFGLLHPSSSNSRASVSEVSNFHNQWNGPSLPSEIPTPYAFPAADLHYQNWEHHSSLFSTTHNRVGSSDQASVAPVSSRSATRMSAEIPRSGTFMYPFHVGHSSSARAGRSVTSSMIPSYPSSNVRARDRVQAPQAYNQQQPSTTPTFRVPLISGTRRSNGRRGSSQAGSVASSSDHSGSYFLPSGSSGRNFPEAENSVPNRFYTWDRDHLSSFSLNRVDRVIPQATGVFDPCIGSRSFRQRGSESAQNQW